MLKTVLLLIDAQEGMYQIDPPVYNGKTLLQNLKKIVSYAREKHIPLIYVQHNGPSGSPLEAGTAGWNIHEEIAPEKHDIILSKDTPDCFYETSLMEHLEKLEITRLILSGIQTELCVDTTCRRGFSLGYKVTLAKDAHSTFDKKDISAQQIINHHNELLRWFADTKTVDEITTN